jgi:hypothetical protein
MSDEPKKRSRGVWIWWVIIVLLLAYPLSMGPVLRYGSQFGLPAAYEPLARFCESWQPLCDLKDWYTELWGERFDRPNPMTHRRTRHSWRSLP